MAILAFENPATFKDAKILVVGCAQRRPAD
jgi:hypothetical protein